jgi:LemA protein
MASPAVAVIGGIACVLLVALAIAAVVAYQRLVSLRDRADTAWAQIEVQLKRRHDLVPHLADAIAPYDRATYDALAAAWRDAEAGLDTALARLAALADAYPEIRSDRFVDRLRGELAAIENLITHTRQSLDEAVEAYNAAVRIPPTSLVAIVGGFRPREPFR